MAKQGETIPLELVLKSRIGMRQAGLEKMKIRHAKERADAERMLYVLRAELEYVTSEKNNQEEL